MCTLMVLWRTALYILRMVIISVYPRMSNIFMVFPDKISTSVGTLWLVKTSRWLLWEYISAT